MKNEAQGVINAKIGKYQCRLSYKIVGVTASAIEDMNKLIAKEENNNEKHGHQQG